MIIETPIRATGLRMKRKIFIMKSLMRVAPILKDFL
jgi:hypothetical protein